MSLKLSVSDVHKSYNGNSVLKGCSFSFDKSGIYVLMGHNGSGKSTFLRLCALLENPDRGEVIYFSSDENLLKKDIELMRRITLLLPKVGVFYTSVFNNVAYGLNIRKIKNKELKERVHRSLELVGLIHKKDQNALTLSSGEIQRIGIARAIVIEPEIFFLDEPTASVDQKNTEIIEDILLKLKTIHNTILIITTHDITQARRLGDLILLVKDGMLSLI